MKKSKPNIIILGGNYIMPLPSVAFILGKREREPINPIANKDKPTAVHYHNNPKDYSYRTDRDYTQAVGKLYKG